MSVCVCGGVGFWAALHILSGHLSLFLKLICLICALDHCARTFWLRSVSWCRQAACTNCTHLPSETARVLMALCHRQKKSTELENICHFSKTADAGLAQWVCLVVFPFERHMIYLRMTGKHFNADLLVHSFLNFTHHNEIVAWVFSAIVFDGVGALHVTLHVPAIYI